MTYTLFEQLRTVSSGERGKWTSRPQYAILLDLRTYLAKGVTSRKPSQKLGDLTLS